VLPTGVPYPSWDPGPRPPRRSARWIALALVVISGVISAVGIERIFGARYAVRADFCSVLDLSPIAKALGTPALSATATSYPGQTDRVTGRPEQGCQFTIEKAGGAPRALGTVTATWYDHAVLGGFSYETQREQAGGSIYRQADVVDVAGVGERAFAYHDAGGRLIQFRVAAVDSNLLLDLRVAVVAGDPAWPAGQTGPPFAALADTIRASLPRVS
jgi:hypothetical protein